METVAAIPMESILIETDCPYLAPNPNRGKRNDSTNLKYVVEKIAEIKKSAPETVAEISEKNAKSLFLNNFSKKFRQNPQKSETLRNPVKSMFLRVFFSKMIADFRYFF